jgi:hypothetical protein
MPSVNSRPIRRPGVYGVVFSGRRYDTGDRVDYIKAILQLACDRDDLGPSCVRGSSSSPRAWIPCPLLRLSLRWRRLDR